MSYKYDDYIDLGFDISQINQILSIIENIDEELLLKYISKDTNIEILRKLNKLSKDMYWTCYETELERILDLASQNIDFTEFADKDVPIEKRNIIYDILTDNDIKNKSGIIKALKYENITMYELEKIIYEDMDRDVDTSLYLKPTYKGGQIHIAHDAFYCDDDEVLNIIDKIDPLIYDYEIIKFMLRENFDIEALTKKQNPDLLSQIFMEKVKGRNVDKFLDRSSTIFKFNYVCEMMKRGYDEEKIELYLKKYPFDRYRISKDNIPGYLNLIENNIDPEEFMQREKSFDYVENFLNVYQIANNKDKEVLLKQNANYERFELELMNVAYACGREDVVSALINCELSDINAYENIGIILKSDIKNKTRHNIINLLFDKGNDVLSTFDKEYEFNRDQKKILSRLMIDKFIDDKNINLIRNNQICSVNMKILANLIKEGFDVSFAIKQAERLNGYDFEAVCKCIELGFEFKDQKQKNINR